MALAIDAQHLAENCMPQVQRDLDKLDGNTVRRFQVLRLCAHATVLQDAAASTARRLSEAGGDLQVANQEALDWQADQDEELHELTVLECLRRQATTSPLLNAGFSKSDFATTLTASCAWAVSPALAVRAQGRSLSSDFQRYSLRSSLLVCYDGTHPSPHFYGVGSGDPNVIPQFAVKYDEWVDSVSLLHILGANDKPYVVVWRLQCDIVDLLSPKPSSQSGRRRRTAEDPPLQLSAPPVDTEEESSEGNRFNGVRYRPNRRRWIAEMKPPKKKNKHSFGDFKSAAEAARGVDAAFHHYDKPNLLNFPDSTGILSTRPSPAAALNDEEKLRFVKAEAKWLASTLPSSRSSESENDIVDPLSPARRLGNSPVQITEGWDAADDSGTVLSNCVNPSQNCEIQTPTMPWFVMSPGIPTVPVPPSPRNFQDEVVRGLLELQRELPLYLGCEEALEVDDFDDHEELRS